MRKIRRIFIHCTATPEGREVEREELYGWHRARGFNDIGYHWVVQLDGKVYPGRPEHKVGAHARGHNKDSIGICYVGGISQEGRPKDTRTAEQIEAIEKLIAGVRKKYGQDIEVWGHSEVAVKACPSFDVRLDRYERRR